MRRGFVYFQQVGGFKALQPWLNTRKAGTEATVVARDIVRRRLPGENLLSWKEVGWDPAAEGHDWLAALEPDFLITDTMNLARDPEGVYGRRLWEMARKTGTPSLAFVDCWWGYRERFFMPGEACAPEYPDYIGVVDDLAGSHMGRGGFPGRSVKGPGQPAFRMAARP